jgi:hypothetical protein
VTRTENGQGIKATCVGSCFSCISRTGSKICDAHRSLRIADVVFQGFLKQSYWLSNQTDKEKAEEMHRTWCNAFQKAAGGGLVHSAATFSRAAASPDNPPPLKTYDSKDSQDEGLDEDESDGNTKEKVVEYNRSKEQKKLATAARNARASRKRHRSPSDSPLSEHPLPVHLDPGQESVVVLPRTWLQNH